MMLSISVLLIALAMGYKVFAEASKEKQGPVRLVGLIVGVVILASSALGLACYAMKCGKGGCPMLSKMCSLKK